MGKVLLVTSSLPRWAGDSTAPFILHIAQDLMALGWHVHVIAPHAPGARTREILCGVPVSRFRYMWPASRQTLCYRGGVLENLYGNPFNGLLVLPFLICQGFAVVKQLWSGKFDLIHSHWILPQGLICSLAALAFRIPHVTTVHGSDIHALRGRFSTLLKRLVLRLATKITVNSRATMAAVRQVAHTSDRVVLIPIGASLADTPSGDRIARLREELRGNDGPLLVFVGRLIEEKGVDDLLLAVAALRSELPGVAALIVGDGPNRRLLEEQAKFLGIETRVTFVGAVKPSDVCVYLAAADIFVGPSKRSPRGGVEGQGLSFVEAMLAGTPVVATAVGGVVDAVQNESTGLLVAEGESSEIVAAVLRLVADPALCERLRTNAAVLARERFTRDATAKSFSTLFRGLLPDHH